MLQETGWVRLTLPGVLAAATAMMLRSQTRTRTPAWGFAVVVTLSVLGAWATPRGYGSIQFERRSASEVLRGPAAPFRGLHTPLAEDVAWIVENVPKGASVMAGDVGMLGSIPDVVIANMRGLTHRPVAEAIARGQAETWVRERLLSNPPDF